MRSITQQITGIEFEWDITSSAPPRKKKGKKSQIKIKFFAFDLTLCAASR